MDENKKSLSEEDIKNRYITPALDKAGWEKTHYRMVKTLKELVK